MMAAVLCGGWAAVAVTQARFPVVQRSTPPTTADEVIERMSATAGVIFAGRVIAVRLPAGIDGSAQNASAGVVEVDFRVDLALRGAMSGSLYTLREWAGLWSAHSERYRVGRRLLLFLHSPDAWGLSSPVAGMEGLIPLRGGGVAPGPADAGTGGPAQTEWLVDLRWVQTRALRRQTAAQRTLCPQPVGPCDQSRRGRDDETPRSAVSRMPGQSTGSLGEQEMVQESAGSAAPDAAPTIETQPLSQVLALCAAAMREPGDPLR